MWYQATYNLDADLFGDGRFKSESPTYTLAQQVPLEGSTQLFSSDCLNLAILAEQHNLYKSSIAFIKAADKKINNLLARQPGGKDVLQTKVCHCLLLFVNG